MTPPIAQTATDPSNSMDRTFFPTKVSTLFSTRTYRHFSPKSSVVPVGAGSKHVSNFSNEKNMIFRFRGICANRTFFPSLDPALQHVLIAPESRAIAALRTLVATSRSPDQRGHMANLPTDSKSTDAAALLEQLKTPSPRAGGVGRVIFALDATASREPTWDRACNIQGEMFEAAAGLGALEIKLAFYRGFNECKVSRPLYSAADLHRVMRGVSCVGGHTQIERILELAIREAQTDSPPSAVIFVGDAMEESADRICHLAGELGARNVPIFLLHEGENITARRVFDQLAKLSGGACLPFDLSSIDRLKALLGAIAVFVTGGREALENYAAKAGGDGLQLTHQLRKGASPNDRRTPQ